MIVGGTGSRIHPLSLGVSATMCCTRRAHDDPSAGFAARSTPGATAWSTAKGRPPSSSRARQHAEARGAKILARIAGFASGFEACTPGQPFRGHGHSRGDSTRPARRANRTRRSGPRQRPRPEHRRTRSGRGHGHSRHAGRRAGRRRRRATSATWGPAPAPSKWSPAWWRFETGQVPFTLNYEQPDPACPINVVHNGPTPPSRRRPCCSIRRRWASRWRWSCADRT